MTVRADLPVEVIFHLLSLLRRRQFHNPRRLSAALLRTPLRGGDWAGLPRPAWWLRLCSAAGLLDEQPLPQPTLLADEWFAWPLPAQLGSLLAAWVSLPPNPARRNYRQRLINDLTADVVPPSELAPAAWQEAAPLYAAGILTVNGTTSLDLYAWQNLTRSDLQFPIQPGPAWSLRRGRLLSPDPPDWGQLWLVDGWLEAEAPGVYRLDEAGLRQARQRWPAASEAPDLAQLLETLLQQPLLAGLRRQAGGAPLLRLLPGILLEFSHPEEIQALRRRPGLGRSLQAGRLTPHHVMLELEQAPPLLRRLERLGLLSQADLQSSGLFAPAEGDGAVRLPRGERAYLLGLLLFSQQAGIYPPPPESLLARLTQGLPLALRGAAVRRSRQALERLQPGADWAAEVELPPPAPGELLSALERAISAGEVVEVLYQSSGRAQPERRRLTPLYLETRGARQYLNAYCHNRRARRLFRLDRMTLAPPEEL